MGQLDLRTRDETDTKWDIMNKLFWERKKKIKNT